MSYNNEFIFYVCIRCGQPLFMNDLVLLTNTETNSIFYNNSNQMIPTSNGIVNCNECNEVIGLYLGNNIIRFNISALRKITIQGPNHN